MTDHIKENRDKIKMNKQLPYLVGNVIELLDISPGDEEEEGGNVDLDAQRKGKCAVVKTSTRQTIFLPVIGLVAASDLKPNDLVGLNKDSYLILELLPAEYDPRVKAMEVDERPTEVYSDIGGLDKQIQELIEAVVLPMTHKVRRAFARMFAVRHALTRRAGAGPLHQARHQAAEGRAAVRAAGHRQNTVGARVRRPDQVDVPEAGRPAAGADVHRRRREARARRLQPGPRESAPASCRGCRCRPGVLTHAASPCCTPPQAPAIIFIDELDAIGPARGSVGPGVSR